MPPPLLQAWPSPPGSLRFLQFLACASHFFPLVSHSPPSSSRLPGPPTPGHPWLRGGALCFCSPLAPFPPARCPRTCHLPNTLAVQEGRAPSTCPPQWPPHLGGASAQEAPSVCCTGGRGSLEPGLRARASWKQRDLGQALFCGSFPCEVVRMAVTYLTTASSAQRCRHLRQIILGCGGVF